MKLIQLLIFVTLFTLSSQLNAQCCGDGVCDPGENATNCPYDCGSTSFNCPNTIGTFHTSPTYPVNYSTANANGWCYTVNGPFPQTVCFQYVVPPAGVDASVSLSISGCNTASVNQSNLGGGGCNTANNTSSDISGSATYDNNCNLITNGIRTGGGNCYTPGDIITICYTVTGTCGSVQICPVISCGTATCPPNTTNPAGCPPFNFSDSTYINVCDNGVNSGIAVVTPDCGSHFSYLWDDPLAQTDSMATNLAPGTYNVLVTNTALGCDTTYTLVVDTVLPNVSDSQYVEICQGDSLLLGGTYQTTAGNYYDTLTSVHGCDSILTTTLALLPVSTFTANLSICQGDSALLGGTYQNTAGSYNDTLVAANGCDSVLTTVLSVISPSTFTTNLSICQGDSVLLGGTYQNSAGSYNDTLTAVNGCDSVLTTILSIFPVTSGTDTVITCQGDSIFVGGAFQTTAGTYYDTLVTSNNCDSILATTLVFNSYFYDTLSIDLCQGDSVYVGGSYQTTSGVFVDTTSTSNGCDSIIQTTVTVIPQPTADFEVIGMNLSCDGTQVQLINNSTNANSYFWNFGDGMTSSEEHPTHVFSTSGNYNVVLTVDSSICSDSHAYNLVIAELQLIIPNVITPNNDGHNDYFTLPVDADLEACTSYKIFNRWGQLLYESKTTEMWDTRTTSGELVPKGTYFYIVEVGKTIYKGTFTIL